MDKLGEWRLIMDCPHVQDNTRAAIARERCEECDKRHEADATLGALVRALPSGHALWRTTATNRWIVTDMRHREVLRTVGEGDTPEKAIAAALKAEGGENAV